MNKNEYDQMRNYMNIKYGNAYLSAISKLSVENPYDDNGLLKPEYTLTEKEKDAVLVYVKEEKEKTDNSQKQADSPSFGETVKRLVARRKAEEETRRKAEEEARRKALSQSLSQTLSQTLSSDFQPYKQGMQQTRDESYQSMIDELPPIEGPMSRKQ